MTEYNSSDLTSILNTLSALSNPAQNPSIPNNNTQSYIQEPSHDDDDAYEPPDTVPVAIPPSKPQPTQQPRPQPQHPQPTTDTIPDPSTIITWPSALRHVMRTVAQNEALQRRIRRLMQSQHDHEKQWWQGREALCRKQMARGEKKRELDEVL